MTDRLLTFCRFLSGLNLIDIPSAVTLQAKKVLIDTLGVIVAGSASRQVSALASNLSGMAGPTVVTCPGRSGDFHPLHAAMLNGMAGSTLEYEEGHAAAMGHPAIQIVPAVMAIAESEDLSGADLIRGLIGGYEAACRISMASRLHQGMHPTGSWGVIGSALGVGLLKGHPPEALAQIAELAACGMAAPWVENSFGGWSASCLFAGAANRAAIEANLQFDCGLKAAPGSLETAFSNFVGDRFKWDRLVDRPGDPFAITGNYFKPYPTCRFTHPALDAVEQIMADNPVDVDRVAEIKVKSFKAATHIVPVPPENAEAARFSIPYLIGVLLSRSRVDLETLTDEAIKDPLVVSLAEKVRLIMDPAFEAMRPENSPARVDIILTDGQRLMREVQDGRGGAQNPIPDQEISDKFMMLSEPVIGTAQARQCLTVLDRLEEEPNVQPIVRLLRTTSEK